MLTTRSFAFLSGSSKQEDLLTALITHLLQWLKIIGLIIKGLGFTYKIGLVIDEEKIIYLIQNVCNITYVKNIRSLNAYSLLTPHP